LRRRTREAAALIAISLFASGAALSWAADPIGVARVYKTVDGRDLKLHVVRPTNRKPWDKRSTIVFFHGGGSVGGDPAQFNEASRYLADRGMVCVQGAKSVIRWVRSHAKELGIDPGRIAAGGGSAGGHLAAFVGMVDGLDDPADNQNVSAKANALILFNPVLDNGPDQGYGFEKVGIRYREFSPAHEERRILEPPRSFEGGVRCPSSEKELPRMERAANSKVRFSRTLIPSFV
jgi:acetyl esterase